MEGYFHDVAAIVTSFIRGEEIHLSTFYGEDSDFVRLNQGRVRQAGAVTMRSLSVDLVQGRRHASGSVSLSGDLVLDRMRIARLVEDLRARSTVLPEDPFLFYATEPRSTARRFANRLPSGGEALEEIRSAARGRDLVGI